MKNGLIVLNVILLLAVGVLFYLHFAPAKTTEGSKDNVSVQRPMVNSTGGCNIGYFEMDSVEANFEMARAWKNELEKKEDNINAQINKLQNKYQEQFIEFQQHKAGMSNAQMEAATNALAQSDENIKNTKASLDQDYKTYYVQTQQEILAMIRKFCSVYNKDKRFAVIISDEPGIVFYKDSTFDITNELLVGLNKLYQKDKTDKKK